MSIYDILLFLGNCFSISRENLMMIDELLSDLSEFKYIKWSFNFHAFSILLAPVKYLSLYTCLFVT